MKIQGKVAVVTGAGKVDPNGNPRIGNHIAFKLAKLGAKVLIHYSSSEEGAMKTVREIRNIGGEAIAFQANLAEDNVGEKIISAAQMHFKAPVQILINSASTFPADDILTFNPDLALETFKIIGIGPTLLMQSMVTRLPEEIEGVIVNFIDARINNRPYPDHLAYSMGKAALSEASAAIALQLAKENIRVVRVSPGAILQAAGKSIEHHKQVISTVPLGREGGVEAIWKAVLFAIKNDFLTGNNIIVDGGKSLT